MGFIPRGLEGVFQQAEHSADIAYFLGKNNDVREKIIRMNPAQAAFEIAKLDMKLAEKPKPKTTKAPDPVKPVGGNESATTKIEDMSADEYIAWKNKQLYGG